MSQRNRLLLLAFAGIAILIFSSVSIAHSGGKDDNGGHMDWQAGEALSQSDWSEEGFQYHLAGRSSGKARSRMQNR